MEIRDAVIWLIIILALCGVALWGITYIAGQFQRPLRIIVIAIAIIALVYLGWGLFAKMAPPFPGALGLP